MRSGLRAWIVPCLWVGLLAASAPAARQAEAAMDAAPSVGAELSVDPSSATVGDRLKLTLTVEAPPGAQLQAPEIGPQLGPFRVVGGAWSGPAPVDRGQRWQWIGELTAFRTGDLEIPSIRFPLQLDDATAVEATTPPRTVTIGSVLDAAEPADAAVIADLKPAASLVPDYGPWLRAAWVLLALLLLSALGVWLYRRYAARLAAVPAPYDPFRRIPPHEWIYAELQKLLDLRLAEQGESERFHSELARILKMYLSGRYRVELMEQTTPEVGPCLLQAGAPDERVSQAVELLQRSDLFKFAKLPASPESCREAVEQVYAIVDGTKPVETQGDAGRRGAA